MSEMLQETDPNPPCRKANYSKSWTFENGNASAGFEVGRHCECWKTHWPELNKWKWVADLISFEFQVHRFEVLFRFYHPFEWRFWMILIHPTRG